MTENGQSVYIVSRRAPTLYMVSRDAYGNTKYWSRIAEKNQIESPYVLEMNQRLVLPLPPKSSDEQANKVLVQAWTSIHGSALAQRLQVCRESTVVVQAAPAQQTVSYVEVETKVQTLPAEPVVQETMRAETTPQPIQQPPLKLSREEPSHAPGHWVFQVAALGSIFKIKTEEPSHAIKNEIYSKFNYGAELEVGYKTSGSMSYFLGAGFERIEFEPADAGEIKVKDDNLLGFSLRAQRQFANPFSMYLSFHYLQRVFASSTIEGVAVDAVYLPEFRLGGNLGLFHLGRLHTQLVADGLYALPTKEGSHDIESSYGYHAGLRFFGHFEKSHSALILTALYREIFAKTSHSKESEKAGIFTMGFEF